MDDCFLTKPADIANFVSDYFKNKVQHIRKDMISKPKGDLSCKTIKNGIMNNKSCTFSFDKVSVMAVKTVLRSMKVKPPGTEELDVQLLKLVADEISVPVCHIINQSFEKCNCLVKWKIAKIMPCAKNSKEPFCGKTVDF